MPVSLKLQSGICTLTISGRFTFEVHREFRKYSEQALDNPECTRLDMDLSEVAYLDSSALGMLLMLRDKAKSTGKSVALISAHGAVQQVIEIANFGKLFSLA